MKKFILSLILAVLIPAATFAEVKRIEVPGCWYGEGRLDGQYACLKANEYIHTSFGRVELPRYTLEGREVADNVLGLRVTPEGEFRISGQSHAGLGNWEWAAGLWRIVGPSYGVNAVIYDWLNQLHFGAPRFGSQGFRYAPLGCASIDCLITGDATYADPARALWEYSCYVDSCVGQGAAGCISVQVDRRMLERGDCRFVRHTRKSDAMVSAFVKQIEGKIVFLWNNVADLTTFPLESVPTPDPIPDPEPKPEPTPTPQPEPASIKHIVERVAASLRGAELLRINTTHALCEFTQLVLREANDPEWGHIAKTAGEGQCVPAGFTPRTINGHAITGVSHDAIYHRANNAQYDIIGNAGANDPCHEPNQDDCWTPGPASAGYSFIDRKWYRANNPWMAAWPLSSTQPDPVPDPTPKPDPNDETIKQLQAQIALLEASIANLNTQLHASQEVYTLLRSELDGTRLQLQRFTDAKTCEERGAFVTGPGFFRSLLGIGCVLK